MQRRLLFAGFLLFFLCMVQGLFLSAFANPRMALSAHVGGAMSGMFLVLVGAVWPHFGKLQRGIWWANVLGHYVLTVGLVLAAVFATRDSTPIAGAAQAALPWQEHTVNATLSLGGLFVLVALVLMLWNLRR